MTGRIRSGRPRVAMTTLTLGSGAAGRASFDAAGAS